MKFSLYPEICTKRDPLLCRIFSKKQVTLHHQKLDGACFHFFLVFLQNKPFLAHNTPERGGLCQRTRSTKRRKMFPVHLQVVDDSRKKDIAEMDSHGRIR